MNENGKESELKQQNQGAPGIPKEEEQSPVHININLQNEYPEFFYILHRTLHKIVENYFHPNF